jgi:hypothetical protein
VSAIAIYRQLAYGFRSLSFHRLLTAPEANGVRMIYRKSTMPGLVAVFSVLLFVDRAPDGGVSDTAVDEAQVSRSSQETP